MRILVCDDEALIRGVIVDYAENEGFECDEVENGQQAIEYCYDNNYDLIIMDIMMPKMDGFEAIRQIRKEKNIV